MGIISNKKKAVLSSCLMIGQLLTANVTWARSSQMEMGLGEPEGRSQVKAKVLDRSSERTKPILLNLPSGGEFRLEGGLGYSSFNMNTSSPQTFNNIYMPQFFSANTNSSSTEETGYQSQISASYGLTDNFYGSVKLNYSSSTEKSVVRNANSFVMAESSVKTDGIKNPSLLVGAQGLMGSTRLFAEVSVDVSLGDRNISRSGFNDWTDNNLSGGMSYSPRLGVIQDLGSVLLYGGASYTIKDTRNKKVTDYNLVTSSQTTGGNSLNLIVGTEFKELSRLGFTMGYAKSDSEETTNQTYLTKSKSASLSKFVASVHAGFKVSENSHLIPALQYATVLEKDFVGGDGLLRNLDRAEIWAFNLMARIGF